MVPPFFGVTLGLEPAKAYHLLPPPFFADVKVPVLSPAGDVKTKPTPNRYQLFQHLEYHL